MNSRASVCRFHFFQATAGLFFALALGAGSGCNNNSSTPTNATDLQDLTASTLEAEDKFISPTGLSYEDLTDGWISLFDGETLFGWTPQSKADWQVENGVITVSSGEPGLLTTNTEFTDFLLSVDFRRHADANSGVFVRTPAAVTIEDVTTTTYEVNIASNDNPFPTGSLVGRQKAQSFIQSNDWQTLLIGARQNEIRIMLNGQTILTYEDPQPVRRGLIGLQFNQGRTDFREIRIKPVGADSIFNGENLDGWKTYPEMATEFTVTKQGELNLKNTREGRGQIETTKSFGDFILQVECISHGYELNSGIFFRCMPGQEMMGYESQIHNGFQEGDRSRPKDCGTGGIFRRQNARRVIPNDHEWFHKTLIAHGNHIAVWVNGYQVTDWIDERDPHENPRKGLRLEPGSIMIQGHDTTTNLSFRNLSLLELSSSK